MAREASPQQAGVAGCLQGPGVSRRSATPSPTDSSGGAGESGCQAVLATSRGHSGTCKLPEPPPQPHRAQRPQRWRVWPGKGPCGRWCWPGGSLPWRWPCWSREREALVKGVPQPHAIQPQPAGLQPPPAPTSTAPPPPWSLVKPSGGGTGLERMPCTLGPRALTPWEK